MTEVEWLTSDDPAKMMRFVANDGSLPGDGPNRKIIATDRQLRLFACACCRQVWPHLTYPGSRQAVEVAELFADSSTYGEELIFATAFLGDNLQPTSLNEFAAWYVSRRSPLPKTLDVFPVDWPTDSIRANILRDIIGNPFRPVCLPTVEVIRACPSDDVMGGVMGGGPLSLVEICPWLTWRDGTIPALAEEAYQERVVRMCERCGGKGRYTAGWKHDVFGSHPLARKSCPDCHGIGTIDTGELDPARLAIIADALEEAGCGNADILTHLRNPGPHVRGCHVIDALRGVQ